MLRKIKFMANIIETEGLFVLFRFLLDRLGFNQTGEYFVSENDAIATVLLDSKKCGVMVDVGAHVGSTCRPFYTRGWYVLAHEPDINSRKILARRVCNFKRVRLDGRALSDQPQIETDFFASSESDGIHGLNDFHSSHYISQKVEVTTLTRSLKEHNIESLDYLKVDTEGNDLRVLQGLDWDSHFPEVLMCEFEDVKSTSYGYSSMDLYTYLSHRYSTVLISEWHPVRKYGTLHRWRRLVDSPEGLDFEGGWGNFIAFKDSNLKALLVAGINMQAGYNDYRKS